MKSSIRKRIASIVFLAALGLALALVPQALRTNPASAQTAGGAAACASGTSPGAPIVVVSPIGTTPTGSGTVSVLPGASCPAAPSFPAGSQPAPIPTVTICGQVTALSAPTGSTAGSVTVNGLTFQIPAGYAMPAYLSTGATVLLVYQTTNKALVEISPGFCVLTPAPLAATSPTSGASGVFLGKMVAN